MLSSTFLSDEDESDLKYCLENIFRSKREKTAFWEKFGLFLERNNVDLIEKTKRSRLLERWDQVSYKDRVYLYDYLIIYYLPELSAFATSSGFDVKLLETIKRLEVMKSRRVASVTFPLSSLLGKGETNKIEKPYSALQDVYLGYRISSEKGEIVRFGFSLSIDEYTHKVTYHNTYQRDALRVTSQGEGAVIKTTLYLSGDAWQSDHPEIGRGVRFFALEYWRDTKLLTGVLISRDKSGPIASRILLIPFDQHAFEIQSESKEGKNLPKEYEALADLKIDKSNPSSKDNQDLLKKVVELDRANYEKYGIGYKHLKNWYFDQTVSAIKSNSKDDAQFSLYLFLSNLTGTTLKAYVSGFESLLAQPKMWNETDNTNLVIIEFLKECRRLGHDPQDELRDALVEHIRTIKGMQGPRY